MLVTDTESCNAIFSELYGRHRNQVGHKPVPESFISMLWHNGWFRLCSLPRIILEIIGVMEKSFFRAVLVLYLIHLVFRYRIFRSILVIETYKKYRTHIYPFYSRFNDIAITFEYPVLCKAAAECQQQSNHTNRCSSHHVKNYFFNLPSYR